MISSLKNDFLSIKCTPTEIKKFCWIVGSVFLVLGAFLIYKQVPSGFVLFFVALILLLFGTVKPNTMLYPYKLWMGLAVVLGFFMTHLILALTFFILITSLSLIARIIGKKFLLLKPFKTDSYWQNRPVLSIDKNRMKKQF